MARARGRLFVSIALVFLFQPCLQNYSHLPAGKGAPVLDNDGKTEEAQSSSGVYVNIQLESYHP